jgi:CheY-like chemotaxis protein
VAPSSTDRSSNNDRPTAARDSESLSSRLLIAQDEERRRISRELHDSVGQSLAAVQMNLYSLLKSQPESSPLTKSIRDSIDIVDQATQELRTVSYLLHPPILDLAGLASAVQWYAEGFAKRSGLDVDVQIPANMKRFESVRETALFRVVQECLTNVHRYAAASMVWICVVQESDELRLQVRDNGKGFPADDLSMNAARVGVGIPGMRQRLRELGGRLDIQSNSNGTVVTAFLPTGARVEQESPDSETASEVSSAPARKPAAGRARVFVVDDHEIIRRGVRDLLAQESDVDICGEASNPLEAIEMLNALQPDLVILDLQMPDGGGWRVVRAIREKRWPVKILIFTAYDYVGILRTATVAGCDGVVNKSRVGTDLALAVISILNGGTFFPASDENALPRRHVRTISA